MKQNAIVALLSVIATLLAVLVFNPLRDARGQGVSAGTATVGHEVAVATGSTLGGSGSAFWLYDPGLKKILVYFLGNTGLELRAVRDIQWDMKAEEINRNQGQMTKVAEVKKAVSKQAAAKKKAEEEEGEE